MCYCFWVRLSGCIFLIMVARLHPPPTPTLPRKTNVTPYLYPNIFRKPRDVMPLRLSHKRVFLPPPPAPPLTLHLHT